MKKNYITLIAFAFVLMMVGGKLFGQVQYKLELLSDGITYKVSMKPAVTWVPPFNLTSSGQVSLKVLHGGLTVTNLTPLVPGTAWANNATYTQPNEAPTMDYFNFGLTSTGTNAFTYTANMEVGLFTFKNTNACIGPVMLLEANDPFMPPNSLNANVGNQLTTLGGGAGNNVWSGNYGGPANCPVTCDVVISNVNGTPATNCGANDGSITITAAGTAPLSYSINNGATWQSSNLFSGLAPGSYQVKVKNNTCEVAHFLNPVTLGAPTAPTIAGVTPVQPSGCGVSNGSISISATGGSGSYHYSIDGGANWSPTNLFGGLASGTYQPAVRNASGTCPVIGVNTVLSAPTSLIVSATPTHPNACGATNGAISVTATGGTGSYEYSKNNGTNWQPSNQFTGLAAGSYPISARNIGGSCATNFGNITLSDPSNCNPNCPVSYQLELLPNGKYQVSLIPHVSWNFPLNITSTAQVTVVAPTGSLVVSNLTNLISGVTFANNSSFPHPNENPSKDYFLFGLTSTGTSAIPYVNGVKVPLFTFENSGTCSGSTIYLMNPDNDPFLPPNDLNANPGQQLTTLGSGIDAHICITGQAVACLPCGPNQPDSDQDGICDAQEQQDGSNPNNPCSPNSTDSDGDGICNVQETVNGSNPNNPCSPNNLDSDGDGICDVQEGINGSNPNSPCSPNNLDSDGDGLCNVAEGLIGSNANDPCDPNPNAGACQDDCEELWNLDVIYVDGSQDPASLCIPIQLGDMTFYDIILNGAPYSQPVEACTFDSLFFYTYAFTVGQGDAGPYLVESWDINGNLAHSGVVADMDDLAAKMNIWNPGGNWTNNPAIDAISGGLDGQNYGTMRLRHILTQVPTILNLNLTFVPFDSRIYFDGPGEYEVVVEQTITGCSDSVLVIVVDPTTDEIEVETDHQEPVTVCLDTDELPGNVASISLCNQPSNGTVTITNDTCFVYTPDDGFTGIDDFCVVICNDTDPQFCDTTIISIEVGGPDCAPIFNEEMILVNGSETDYCIPFDNLQLLSSTVYLDDVVYNSLGYYCSEDTLSYYSYAFTVGQGNTGPYIVNYWNVNSGSHSGMVVDMNDLAAKMNLWDPTGNWVNNPSTSTISGGSPSQSYGDLKLTHVLTQVPTVMEANFTLVNGGISVHVEGEGQHEIVVYNPLSGCTDTLVVWLNQVTPDHLTYTIHENTSVPTTCLSQVELPGGSTSIAFCGQPQHGTVTLSNNACFSYTPANGFIGQDAFCLVMCNGTQPQFCDTTYVLVTVLPSPDTIPLTIDPVGPTVHCLPQLPGAVVSASICGETPNEVDATVTSNPLCISFNPADDFGGFSEVCVIHCFAGQVNGAPICDTTVFIITVLPPQDTLDVVIDSNDPDTVCLQSVLNLPGDIANGSICGYNPNQVAVSVGLDGCVIIDPLPGFTGNTEICVVYCDDSQPSLCDTTIIHVDVLNDCGSIFASNDTLVTYTPNVCVPLAFSQWSLYDIVLNNAPYVYPPSGCNDQVLVYYTYAFMVGQGNTGPYQVTSWKVNNQTFTGTVANAAALVAQMNVWDPAGNWQYNPSSLTISGGAQTNTYDQLRVKHVLTNVPTFMQPNRTTVANGTLVNVTQSGLNQLVAIDTVTGCTDTVYIWYVNTTPDTVHVTTQMGTTTSPVCLNLTELEGTPQQPTLCSTPQHGTVSFANNCLQYQPSPGYVGEESFCVVICDDNNPQFCDTTTVIVTVLPPDDVKNVTIYSGQPQTVCLGNLLQFPGQIVSTSLCAPLPQSVTAVPTNNGCVNFNTTPGFTGNAQVCVQHCYIAPISGTTVCDTTFINLTVLSGTEVVDIILTEVDTHLLCLQQYIDLPSSIGSAAICGENPGEVDATVGLNGCVILDPAPGFFGTTSICVVFCTGGQVQLCDTTVINITMDIDCQDIFGGPGIDTIYTNEPKVCIPLAFSEANLYDIILNGQDYLFPPQPCNEDTLVFYTYSFTIGAGNAGPYKVQSWNVNGQVMTATVANMYELAAKMNLWDPNGNWVNNPDSYSISGGTNGGTYGLMILKHIGTGIPALLRPNYTNVALGTCVQLDGPGWNQIVVVDTLTGCSDTLMVYQEGEQLSVVPKVILQGAFDSNNALMKDNLRQLNLLPTTEPYSAIPQFVHVNGGGGEVVAPGVFAVTGPDAIVDWVFLELRSATNPATVLATRSALLQRDGHVVDVDGFSPVAFAMPDGDYYLAIRHRNHLGAMTKLPIALHSGATVVDFTASTFLAYGTNAMRTAANKQMLWGGNANADDRLVFQGGSNDTDAVFFQVITAPGNTTFSQNFIYDGYHLGDTNMDGQVIFQGIGNDVDFMVFYNLLTHPQNSAYLINFIFEEQLP